MKILILCLSMLSAAAFAGPTCTDLYREAESACNSNVVECLNLGACVSKRKTCPMDIGSPSACESFDHCMKDTDALVSAKPADMPKSKLENRCIYTWNGGKCYLYNTGWEILTFPSCPGRRIWGKGNDDKNFDCDGHRRHTVTVNKECVQKNTAYEKACKGKKGFKKNPKSTACKYLTAKVFPADTEHKGAKSVDDGKRDRQKSIPHWDEGAGGDGKGSKGTGK